MDGSLGANLIGAQSSAVVLLYFAFGCFSLPSSSKASVVQYLNSSSEVATFARTIASRIAANPTAIQDGDSQIGSALLSAYTALGGTTSTAKSRKPTSIAEPANQDLQLLLQPTGQQSGFEVLQTENSNSLAGTNPFRRPSQMYIYKVGDVDSAGVTTDVTPAKLITAPIDVPETSALSIGSTLKNLFSGQTAFVPVTSSSITLPLDSAQSKTLYEIVILFASASTTQPAFYSDPKYVNELTIWQIEQRNLNLYSFFIDLVFAGMLEILGVRDIIANETQLQAAAAAIAAIPDTAWQEIVKSAKYGAFGPVLKNAVTIALSSDIVSLQIRKELAALIPLATQRAAFLTKTIPSTALAMLNGAYVIAGLALGIGDVGAVLADVANSEQGDLWTGVVSQPTLHLSPTAVSVIPGSTTPTEFTVAPPMGLTGSLVWTWTLTGEIAAQISDEAGHQGTTLTQINSKTVYLLTTPSDQHNMTLQVEGFIKDSSGATTSIGRASASILVTAQGTLVTRTWTITLNEGSTQDPTAAGEFVFVYGFFSFPETPGATNYKVFTPTQNTYNLSASSVAGLPLATDTLDFPEGGPTQGSAPPWGQFVRLGNGMLGCMVNWTFFSFPDTQYKSPDGVQVTAAGQEFVVWRFLTKEGQYVYYGTDTPLPEAVISNTLSYMASIEQKQIDTKSLPVLTVT